jgi:hypothetical protein
MLAEVLNPQPGLVVTASSLESVIEEAWGWTSPMVVPVEAKPDHCAIAPVAHLRVFPGSGAPVQKGFHGEEL